MKKHCKNCAYYDKITDKGGECRWRPPMVVARLAAGAIWEFPETYADYWCGQFLAKNKKEE